MPRKAMLYESKGVRVDVDEGIATLWLDFPLSPVNALSPARLEEIAGGISAAVETPSVEILVVRSAKLAGFCGGIDYDFVCGLRRESERAAFARAGQQVFSQLATVPFPTVAFIHGPCFGAGLELALACDSRLAVAGPDSEIGFPDAASGLIPCWGGTTRLARLLGRKTAMHLLRSGQILSGREAVRIGLFDDAFCERRAKIELRTFLDHLQRTGSKPRRWKWPRRRMIPSNSIASTMRMNVFEELCRASMQSSAEGETAERKWFLDCLESNAVQTVLKLPPRIKTANVYHPILEVVEKWTVENAELAGRTALRGGRILVSNEEGESSPFLDRYFETVVNRRFVTPLEAEQARRRIETVCRKPDVAVIVRRVAA
jgi:enoyl-CoA hydratase